MSAGRAPEGGSGRVGGVGLRGMLSLPLSLSRCLFLVCFCCSCKRSVNSIPPNGNHPKLAEQRPRFLPPSQPATKSATPSQAVPVILILLMSIFPSSKAASRRDRERSLARRRGRDRAAARLAAGTRWEGRQGARRWPWIPWSAPSCSYSTYDELALWREPTLTNSHLRERATRQAKKSQVRDVDSSRSTSSSSPACLSKLNPPCPT